MSQEIIFNDGDAFFDDLLDSISRAASSVYIETYIFDLDVLGIKLMDALAIAVKRGVTVKLLLDGAGCSQWDYETARTYRKQNIELQFFHPMFWQRKKSNLLSYLNIRKFTKGWSLLNHRNHRKVFLIDEICAYVGSFNVSARHLKSVYPKDAWRDTGVKIDDERIKVLHESFMEAWNHHHYYQLRKTKNRLSPLLSFVMLNRTLRERRETAHKLLSKLRNAKSKVQITNPYFIPGKRLRRALKSCVDRGVPVTTIFPSRSDFFGVKRAMESFYASLLKSGIQIYEYQPSMIHAKILVTDDQVVLGSSNMNSRSMLLDLEVDVAVLKPENISLIEKQFQDDLGQSKKIELEVWKKRSFFLKIQEKIFYLFRWVL